MRIASLLSSATEIVHCLGLADSLVAISHECDFPEAVLDLPRASRVRFDPEGLDSAAIDAAVRDAMAAHGSVYEVDSALLHELRPDLILTQAVCEVCAVPTGSVRDALQGFAHPPEVVSLDAHTLPGILATVEQVATAAGVAERGRRTAGDLRKRLETVAAAVADRPPARVLMLEWMDPPFAPGHWVPEMVRYAGGRCLVGAEGERSREVNWSEVADLDPDVVLVEPCGYDLERARVEAERFRDHIASLAPRAAASGRVWALDSAWFSRSGPRAIEGVEALASVLHPSAFPEPAPGRIAAPCL